CLIETRRKLIEPGEEELGSFCLPVGIGKFAHKKKQQLWILRRSRAIHGLKIFEFRTGSRTSIFDLVAEWLVRVRPGQNTRSIDSHGHFLSLAFRLFTGSGLSWMPLRGLTEIPESGELLRGILLTEC